MSIFPATDIALEGFRLTRERFREVAIWSSLQVFSSMMALVAIMIFASKEMADFTTTLRGVTSVEQVMKAIEPLMPILLYLTPLNVAVQTVLLAACYRVILRKTETRHAFLGFGSDELRLFLVGVILTVGAFFGLTVTRIIGDGLTSLFAAAGPVGRLVSVTYSAVTMIAIVYVFVRLSLALPLTFARRKMSIRESWALTRGRHLQLGGSYFMAFILAALVYVLGAVIGSVLQSIDGVVGLEAKSLLTPGMIGSTAWMAAIGVLIGIIVQAPGAEAVLHLGSAPGPGRR